MYRDSNQRLDQIEASLNRSRSTLAQSQSYGNYGNPNTLPYYSNGMASVGSSYHRNHSTAQQVAEIQQLEQQRSMLLEQSRLRNLNAGNLHRVRAQQLRNTTRYEAELRAQQNVQRQQEMQMRAHVYNTMSSLPTTPGMLPMVNGATAGLGGLYGGVPFYDPYQAQAQATLAQARAQAQAQAAYALEQQRQALEYERTVRHHQTVQAMRNEADRYENEQNLASEKRRQVAKAAAARGRSFQSKLADQQARTEAAASAAAASAAERSATIARHAYEQASMSDMRAMQMSAQLQRDRELFQVLTSNTLPGVDIELYDPMLDDLYVEPFRSTGEIYTHPWRPSNNNNKLIHRNTQEMSWRGRKVRVRHAQTGQVLGEEGPSMSTVVIVPESSGKDEHKEHKEQPTKTTTKTAGAAATTTAATAATIAATTTTAAPNKQHAVASTPQVDSNAIETIETIETKEDEPQVESTSVKPNIETKEDIVPVVDVKKKHMEHTKQRVELRQAEHEGEAKKKARDDHLHERVENRHKANEKAKEKNKDENTQQSKEEEKKVTDLKKEEDAKPEEEENKEVTTALSKKQEKEAPNLKKEEDAKPEEEENKEVPNNKKEEDAKPEEEENKGVPNNKKEEDAKPEEEENKEATDQKEKDKSETESEKKQEPKTIVIQGISYTSEGPSIMIPIGNTDMINNNENHRTVTSSSNANIVAIGSGFHKAMEFVPILQGVTPDIKGEFNAEDPQGKVVFATLKQVCDSVDKATRLKIRKDPLAAKEQEADGNEEALAALAQEKEARLLTYKNNFKAWVTSLAPPDATETTRLTFLRNMYPMDETGQYVPTEVKPSWVVGLGVDAALDCGSGKVALVDGVTGAQLGNEKWGTNEQDARWTTEDIEKNADMCRTLCGDREATVAYGTGNWRKEHMASTVKPFQDAMAKRKIDFQLLPGALEAKYGGISSLKCTVPYDKTTEEWVVIELGGGSTQISRFLKENKDGALKKAAATKVE